MVESEVELLTREAVTVLLDVGPRYDGHLLARDGAGCETQRNTHTYEHVTCELQFQEEDCHMKTNDSN